MRKFLVLCAVGLVGAAFASSANAVIIDGGDLAGCSGLANCPVTGATISADGGTLEGKSFDGQFGLGVAGATGGEIDFGESLSVAFDVNAVLDAFRIVFFYNGPEFGDANEQGSVTVNYANGGSDVFTLLATGENMATISSGLGSVVNCGATTEASSGCFDFIGAFGDALISSIVFEAANIPSPGGNNSDFALGGLEFTAIPIPGALVLLISGLGGLAFAARGGRPSVVRL